MNKNIKALTQNILCILPENLSYQINRLLQSAIGSWDLNYSNYKSKESLIHLNLLKNFHLSSSNRITHVEFGGGWDLSIPMEFYKAGILSQIIFDLNPHLDFHLMTKVAKAKIGYEGAILNSKVIRKQFGIDYKVMDITDYKFEKNIDFITSTNTLEHIPQKLIIKMFSFFHNNLSDDGIITSIIDFSDHYSRVDKNVSKYDFLKYSRNSLIWKFYNNRFQYTNRIRFSEFESIFKKIGFNILYSERLYPDVVELQRFNNVKVHDDFSHLSLEDLKTTGMIVCLKKR